MPLLSDYPGMNRALWRAARLENLLHDLTFLTTEGNIRGIPVRQLTPRMVGLLLFVGSPFLVQGAARAPGDVAQLLWIVSPDYKPDQKAADAYMKAIPLMEAGRDGRLVPTFRMFYRAIDRYLRLAFIDRPPAAAGSSSSPSVAFHAGMIDAIASSYGWSEEEILDKPIARLYQLLKLILHRAGVPSFAPYQDPVRRRIVTRWRNKAAALGVPIEELLASMKKAA